MDLELSEQILELIKEHLTVEISESDMPYSKGVKVTLKLNGKEISSDYLELEYDNYV